METPHGLACALRDALSQQHEASTPALVAHHNDGGTTRSFCVSTLALRAWITASVDVMASLLHPTSSSVVVALALPPCSAEESASMLLVALQPHWIFVPLDVRSPPAQLKSRLLDVGADVLITWEQSGVCLDDFKTMTRLPALYPSSLTMRVVCFSTVTGQLPQRSWLESCASPPLYILPTSGTTGHAKGVVGTRVGALERVFWSQHALPMDPQRDVVLRTTRLTFVDAVAEILGACSCRVPLVHLHFFHENNATLVDSVVLHSPRALLDVVAHWRVTRFTVVPTVLRLLLHAVGPLQEERGSARGGQRLAILQILLVSGEPLPLRVVDECFRVVPHVTLVNLYGSTEVSGDVTWKMLRAPLTLAQHEKWSRLGVPIGESPVCAIGASTQIRLEREANDTTGDAEPLSEFWVRGGAVAAGYVVDKKLVRPPGKWICDSDSGIQWFRMGDLCRVVDGELFLCGRKDRQVKVRGNRLQLEDVERAIKRAVRDLPPFADVCDVIVSPVDTPTAAADSEMKLLAILLVDGDLASGTTRCGSCQVMNIDVLSKRQLYDRLAGECGELFVPHAVAAIDASSIPRHSNGKVDLVRTHALCEDHMRHSALHNSVSPAEGLVSTDTRIEALALVCEVLGSTDTLNDSDRRATWLQLGGNSLQAALLSWEADHRLNAFIPAPDILHMEIHELLDRMASRKRKLGENESTEISVLAPAVVRQRTKGAGSTREDHHHGLKSPWSWFSRYNQSSLWSENQAALLLPSIESHRLPAATHLRVEPIARVDLGKCIDASPLIIRHHRHTNMLRTLIGSHSGQFVCLELDSVTHKPHVKWTQRLDDRIEATATICVNHELVFVGSYSGRLYALELETGAERWVFQARDMIKSSALVIESLGLVIVGAYDQCLNALDLTAGTVVWAQDVAGSVFSTPVYAEASRVLVVATTSGVVLAWHLSTRERIDLLWKKTLPAPVFASLVLTGFTGDRAVAVGCADGIVYALSLASGDTKWTMSTPKPIFCTPSVYHTTSNTNTQSVIVGSHDGKLRKISATDGVLQWERGVCASPTAGDAIFASPFVAALRLDGAEDTRMAVVCAATTSGRLVFLHEATGRVVPSTIEGTTEATLGEIFSSPVVVDELCFVGTRSNWLLVYRLELVSA